MICPNPKCERIVSPFDEKCGHCGAPLKQNPIRSYEQKADSIVHESSVRAKEFVKDRPRISRREDWKNLDSAINVLRNMSRTGRESSLSQSYKAVSTSIKETNIPDDLKLHLQSVEHWKSVKVKEMEGFVFKNPYITGNPNYGPKIDKTILYYRTEYNIQECSPSNHSPLWVNATARVSEESKGYEINLFDGYLNFIFAVEAVFQTQGSKAYAVSSYWLTQTERRRHLSMG